MKSFSVFASVVTCIVVAACGGTGAEETSSTDEAFSSWGGEIILFENDNFSGANVSLRGDTQNFTDFGFNDLVSSVIVQSGDWVLCEHAFFGGRCNQFGPGQYPSMRPFGVNDLYSSARLLSQGPGPGPGPGPSWGQPTGLAWSYAGPIWGKYCLQITEPSDPDTWSDNYLCMDRDVGLRWSYAGPIGTMTCISMNESAEPGQHTWMDNYLCSPRDVGLRWSTAGQLWGSRCVQIVEPSDPHTWSDNYLCLP